jgi:hypothetical protein
LRASNAAERTLNPLLCCSASRLPDRFARDEVAVSNQLEMRAWVEVFFGAAVKIRRQEHITSSNAEAE